MRSGNRLLFSAIVLVLALQDAASAAIIPHYTVDDMCDKADAIIEGTYLGKNEVRIDKLLKTSMLLKDESRTIEVSQLNEHSRTLWNGKLLEADKVVLFLVQEKGTGGWESISTIDDEGKCGSCGLFWFDDSTGYGYMQRMNPGPYVLFPAKHSEWRTPKTIEAMRTDIETGLANSREWRRSLAIKDPTEKARALARYLLKRVQSCHSTGNRENRAFLACLSV